MTTIRPTASSQSRSDDAKLGANSVVRERNGVLYVKRWVVELVLDLTGYNADQNLQPLLAIEPAAGNGSFILSLVERLVESCQRFDRPLATVRDLLIAYELDPLPGRVPRRLGPRCTLPLWEAR